MLDPKTFLFADDGVVPNNPLPFLLYASAVGKAGPEPEADIENLFDANGWGHQRWRNGIFYYLHYHPNVHEALGIARGWARVQLGGESGEVIRVMAGDVIVLPAGAGHCCLETGDDFSVVGGYPAGPQMQIMRPTKPNHAKALRAIKKVPIPDSDPVQGKGGALTRLWSA
jgi:uncharacterized protein YjlB